MASEIVTGKLRRGPYTITHKFERVDGGFKFISSEVERDFPFRVRPDKAPKVLHPDFWIDNSDFPAPAEGFSGSFILTEAQLKEFGV